jgi:hypothetical protein
MSSEKALWQHLRKEMKGYGKWKRIENICDPGMPDVLYLVSAATGFIELKEIDSLPKKPSTPVLMGIRTAQKFWHKEWYEGGGRSWLLLQVSSPRQYYLIAGCDVHICETWNVHELGKLSAWHDNDLNGESLAAILQRFP